VLARIHRVEYDYAMKQMDANEWSFDDIRSVDPQRAARLEACRVPGELPEALAAALDDAIRNDNVRFATDSKANKLVECRSILQYRVPVDLYDWFFNGYTGYRGQYFVDEGVGTALNRQIIERIADVLRHTLPVFIPVRVIELLPQSGSREEVDVGERVVTRDSFLLSLSPDVSKIWMCERLYSGGPGPVTEQIGIATLIEAGRSRAKLRVPKWNKRNPDTGEVAEGLRAPSPLPEHSWLDVKGGFLDPNGKLTQVKPQDTRARQLNEYGWTWASK
jgi:hypothetical protein